ncbi:hypothetical protein D3C80_1808630 [compost metagenome]
MIERYRHDNGNGRVIDHIGRIEAPTEPNLDHGSICRMLREEQKHRGGQNFENRYHLAAVGSFDAAQRIRKDGIIDITAFFAGNADAITFMPVHEMRRGVNVHGKSCRLQ